MSEKSSKPPRTTRQPTTLPAPIRHITAHDQNGKSIFHSSSGTATPQLYYGADGIGGMCRSYAVPSVPVTMTDNVDLSAYLATNTETSYSRPEIVQGNGTGVNLVVVDLGPGGESQMHQTVSIDYSICIFGRIVSELDSGQRVELGPGVCCSLSC